MEIAKSDCLLDAKKCGGASIKIKDKREKKHVVFI